jgi:5-methylcytosine-specific restriction protein A
VSRPRASKVCSDVHCAAIIAPGTSYCDEHDAARDRGAWGSGRTATPEWRALRAQILARDKHQCQLRHDGCKIAANIADHIVPVAAGGADSLTNGQAVCGSCHDIKTAQERRYLQWGTGIRPWPDNPALMAGPPQSPTPKRSKASKRKAGEPVRIATAPKPITMRAG